MFLGTHSTSLINTNRIILPKKFRILFKGNQIVLTKGLDQCIWGFDLENWQKVTDEYLKLPIGEGENREKRRNIFGEAEVVELDKQGRFLVPLRLMEYAKLKKDLDLVGIGDRFEIWNPRELRKIRRNDGRLS